MAIINDVRTTISMSVELDRKVSEFMNRYEMRSRSQAIRYMIIKSLLFDEIDRNPENYSTIATFRRHIGDNE